MITATDELKRLWESIRKAVIHMVWYLICIGIGVILGNFYTEGRILDDCRYSSTFRVGAQAFTCQRR